MSCYDVNRKQAWLQRNPQLDKNRLLGRAVNRGTARMCALLIQSGADPNVDATIGNSTGGSVLYQVFTAYPTKPYLNLFLWRVLGLGA